MKLHPNQTKTDPGPRSAEEGAAVKARLPYPVWYEHKLIDKPERRSLVAHMTIRIALLAFWLGVGWVALRWILI